MESTFERMADIIACYSIMQKFDMHACIDDPTSFVCLINELGFRKNKRLYTTKSLVADFYSLTEEERKKILTEYKDSLIFENMLEVMISPSYLTN